MTNDKKFIEEPKGVIYCTQCNQELGNYSWLGASNGNSLGMLNFGSLTKIPYFNINMAKIMEKSEL